MNKKRINTARKGRLGDKNVIEVFNNGLGKLILDVTTSAASKGRFDIVFRLKNVVLFCQTKWDSWPGIDEEGDLMRATGGKAQIVFCVNICEGKIRVYQKSTMPTSQFITRINYEQMTKELFFDYVKLHNSD